jgi:membrane protease YdiL (CAAX protease family)
MRAAPPQAGRDAPPLAVTVPVALLTWAMCWLGGNLLGSAVITATGHASGGDDALPTWVTLLGALALWTPLVLGAIWASRTHGTGSLRDDLGLRAERVDLLGLPLGIACQLLLVRAVYLPLEAIWPDTFADDRVEDSARRLYEAADGWWLVGLVLMVVVGAPIVEELVSRGLLQGALVRRVHPAVAVVGVALLFALVHFSWVQYPGLFAFGLVLGVCALRTRRLGMAIAAHVGFNAAGLAWVALR